MKVALHCFGMLKDLLPPESTEGRLTLRLPEGASVNDAVLAAGLPPGKINAILLGGAPATLESLLIDGSEVTLMPQFTGG